jgi:uncharacterized membrane protein
MAVSNRPDARISLAFAPSGRHIACMTLIRKHGTLAKTASFALVHFGVAFAVGYLLTGSVAVASALALVEPMANTVAYYFHERAWQWVKRTTSSRAASPASAFAAE